MQRGTVRVEVSEQADFGTVVDDLVEDMQRQVDGAAVGVRSPGWPERRGPLAGGEPGQPGAPGLVMLIEESGYRAGARWEFDLLYGQFRVSEPAVRKAADCHAAQMAEPPGNGCHRYWVRGGAAASASVKVPSAIVALAQ